MSDTEQATRTQWWLAVLGDLLVWARLREFADDHAEIFAADGRHMFFASSDSARSAVLDAGFRALDGLDEDDAHELGFNLASIAPPAADTDEDLLPLMTQQLIGHA